MNEMPKNTVHEGPTYGAHEADVVETDDPAVATAVAGRQVTDLATENQWLRDKLRAAEEQRDNALAALRNERLDRSRADGAEVADEDYANADRATEGNKLVDQLDTEDVKNAAQLDSEDAKNTVQTSKSTSAKAKS